MLTGIDVGGTRIKGGLITEDGELVHEVTLWLTDADRTEEGMVQRLSQLIHSLGPSDSVGIGVAGVVDQQQQCISESPNFPLWSQFRLAERIHQEIQRPVLIDNDANCVIRGEQTAGVAQGVPNLIGLTLGTGVGGAVILNGRVWRGSKGMAGEIGHTVVNPAGAKCGCGSVGCLETYASAVGLRRLCEGERPDGMTNEELFRADLPMQLAERAANGDAVARKHFTSAGKALGVTIASMINVLNVPVVVLAGGVAQAYPFMEKATLETIKERAFDEIARDLSIRCGTLDERAGIIGAALSVSE